MVLVQESGVNPGPPQKVDTIGNYSNRNRTPLANKRDVRFLLLHPQHDYDVVFLANSDNPCT
jgi:hypothetical protein